MSCDKHILILGTDWWTDCDDAVAVRVLSQMQKQGKIELLGVVINACMPYSAASLDAYLQHEGFYNIPLGIDAEAVDYGGNPPYQESLLSLPGRFRSNDECENGVKLYRRLLGEAEKPVDIIEIGFTQVLSALLMSEPDEYAGLNGTELVKSKVGRFWVMAGKWDDTVNGKEHNFAKTARARKAAHIFCEKCPVPITFLGFEVGEKVITGSALKKDDVLLMILEKHGSPKGRSSWDPMTAYLACIHDEEKAGYTTVTGTASVEADTGINHFDINENGLHRYVVKKYQDSYYENFLNSLITI